MRTFAGAYPDSMIAQQLLHDVPWGHITHLLDRVHVAQERDWYAEQALHYGWSRSLLLHHVTSDLRERPLAFAPR